MAEIPLQRIEKSGKYMVYLWETVTAGDTCEALPVHDFDDLTLYVVGTNDTGVVGITGCATQSGTYVALRDMLTAAAMAITPPGTGLVADGALFVKPTLTGGTTVDLDIYLVAK